MGLRVHKRKDGTVGIVGDPPATHHFIPSWVDTGVFEGWISLGGGKITIHADDGDVVYNIVTPPGAYCSHCGDKVGDGPAATPELVAERMAYVAQCKKAKGEPELYEVRNYYLTELEG